MDGDVGTSGSGDVAGGEVPFGGSLSFCTVSPAGVLSQSCAASVAAGAGSAVTGSTSGGTAAERVGCSVRGESGMESVAAGGAEMAVIASLQGADNSGAVTEELRGEAGETSVGR